MSLASCLKHARRLICGMLALSSCLAQTPAQYRYFRVGNVTDTVTKTQPGFALIGGGKDLDPAFLWLCQHSGGGDFLILRATGTDAYNSYVQLLCHVNSVATLVIPNKAAANDPFVAETISKAEAIFISGGDQANYINFWQNTPVQKLLNDAIHKGVPVGGTSAGLAVQSEYIYSAQNDPHDGPDLTSKLALANPFHPQIVIAHNFLDDPALKGTITDTHFVTRDRMGRLLTFMARISADHGNLPVKGIGIDEQTAVLMEPDGHATVVGHGAAYFFTLSTKEAVLKEAVPLTVKNITVQKATSGSKFDLSNWTGNAEKYQLSVDAGTIHSTKPDGKIY
ncbi:cyanophycinase [Acidobacterium sp. S8]|uniref:cyanophycinase n=1 Tax=Acidobacterium sp. S8 TaxID=1641854 RepID=UPI00131E8C6D|nr:cyanophycinase [Acidobacterium sp. S8]